MFVVVGGERGDIRFQIRPIHFGFYAGVFNMQCLLTFLVLHCNRSVFIRTSALIIRTTLWRQFKLY